MIPRPPRSTLFPYATLFRSDATPPQPDAAADAQATSRDSSSRPGGGGGGGGDGAGGGGGKPAAKKARVAPSESVTIDPPRRRSQRIADKRLAAEKSAAEEAAAEEAATEKAATDDSSTDDSSTDDSSTDEEFAKKPTAKKPAKKSTANEPAAKRPAAKKPAAKKPGAARRGTKPRRTVPLQPGLDDEDIRQQALAKYVKDEQARIEAGRALCGKDPGEFDIIHAVDPGKKAHCFLTLDHGDNAGNSRQDMHTRFECRQAHIARYAAERAEAQKSGVSRRSLRGHRRGPAVGSKSNAFFTVAASGHRSQTETTNHVQMAHRRWRRDDDDVTPHTDDTALATALARLYEMPRTWAAKYRKENSGRRSRDREKLRHRQLRWLHRTAEQIAPEGKKTLLLVGSFVKKYMGPRQPPFYGFDPVPIKALFRYLETLTDRVKIHVVNEYRSEERRVGKECRSRWSAYH